MSKSTQNSFYYEIGVVSPEGKLVKEYVTDLPIIKKGESVYNEFVDFVKKIHGQDTIILWNRVEGEIPDDGRSRIALDIPPKSEFKYNR
jgi:hypothetical protein